MANDQSSDVLSDEERGIAQRLIGDINEFNLKSTGTAEFHEMLTIETDDDGELLADVRLELGGSIEALWVARTCGVTVSAAGC